MEDFLNLVSAMSWVLGMWVVIFTTILGLGLCASRYLAPRGFSDVFSAFWYGLAILIALLQVLHFFMPLGLNGLLTCLTVSLLAGGFELFRVIKQHVLLLCSRPKLLLTVVLIVLWFANRCIGPNSCGDSQLYHLQQIRWVTEHPIIPGLSNLCVYLGISNSSILLDSLVDIGPLHTHSQLVTHGLLCCVIILQGVVSAGFGFGRQSPAHPCGAAPWYVILIPLVLELTTPGNFAFTEVAASMPVFVSLSGMLWLFSRKHWQAPETAVAVQCIVMLTAAVCLKHVTIFFAFAACLSILIWGFFKMSAGQRLRLLPGILIAAVLISCWLIRSFIYSGYPMFPNKMGSWFDVPWKLPVAIIDQCQATSSVVTNSTLHQIDPSLTGWDWFKPYLSRMISQAKIMFDLPFIITGLLWFMLLFNQVRMAPRLARAYALLVCLLVISTIPWFLKYAVIRYGFFLFWSLCFITAAFTLKSVSTQHLRRWSLAILFGSLLIGIGSQVYRVFRYDEPDVDKATALRELIFYSPGERSGFHISKVEKNNVCTIEERITRFGLKVYFLKDHTDYPGYTPLLATPFYNNNLRLIKPGDVRSGFVVEGEPGDPKQGWGEFDYSLEKAKK